MNESLGFKLTNADWDLLEGIGAVLQVSFPQIQCRFLNSLFRFLTESNRP